MICKLGILNYLLVKNTYIGFFGVYCVCVSMYGMCVYVSVCNVYVCVSVCESVYV